MVRSAHRPEGSERRVDGNGPTYTGSLGSVLNIIALSGVSDIS
jgi:hypothetical protein